MIYNNEAYQALKSKDKEKWRGQKEKTSSIRLMYADLGGVKLDGFDLTDVDFRGANLEHASFKECNVENANISSTLYSTWLWAVLALSFFIYLGAIYATQGSAQGGLIIEYFLPNIDNLSQTVRNVLVVNLVGLLTFLTIFGTMVRNIASTVTIGTLVLTGMFSGTVAALGFFAGITPIPDAIPTKYALFLLPIAFFINYSVTIFFLPYVERSAQEAIATAKNPHEAQGFNPKYSKAIRCSVKQEDANLAQKSSNTREEASQQMDEMMRQIAYPYQEKLRKYSDTLKIHNAIYYVIILMFLIGFIVMLLQGYYLDRLDDFNKVLDYLPEKDKAFSLFGGSAGIVLFYATPILFGISVIVYSIFQVNHNLKHIHAMQVAIADHDSFRKSILIEIELLPNISKCNKLKRIKSFQEKLHMTTVGNGYELEEKKKIEVLLANMVETFLKKIKPSISGES